MCKPRPVEKVEVLNIWVDQHADKQKSNIDGLAFRTKACELYEFAIWEEGQSSWHEFQISKGWLHRFLNHYLKRMGESDSAYTEAAKRYWPVC